MSEDEKVQKMQKEKRAFIKEQTAQNKKIQLRKKRDTILFVIVVAIVFGFVSSLVFVCTTRWLNHKTWGEESMENPQDTQQSPTPEPAPASTKEPEQTAKPAGQSQSAAKNGSFRMRDISKLSRLMEDFVMKQEYGMVTVSALQTGKDWFDNPTVSSESTYGIVLEKQGQTIRVLTEAKVLSMGEKLQVSVTEEEMALPATILASSKSMGLAVLEVSLKGLSKETAERIQEVKFYAGNGPTLSSTVLLLGKSNGYLGSAQWGRVTTGAIRKDTTDNRLSLYLTDYPANEKAAGVVLNLDGELIGILTNDFQEELGSTGLAFMGIKEIKHDIARLLSGKSLRYLGIKGQDMTEQAIQELGAKEGVYVTEIESGSPAYKAGMRNGDVITALGDETITSIYQLNEVLQSDIVDNTVSATIIRTAGKKTGGRRMKLNLSKRK